MAIVYQFDPIYCNGTTFCLDDTFAISSNWIECVRANQPIAASCFPPSLTFEMSSAVLPAMFHTSRSFNMFSEPARVLMEQRAPGQVEFIPVAVQAPPTIAARLKFASAYYFINVLGRAQRLQWLDMPTQTLGTREDGTE